MSVKRAHNFNPGPAVLPWEVLEEASQAILEFAGTGMSILEVSHRAKEFENVLNTAVADLKEILGIPAGYSVLFLQGGASHQFSMIPYNFLLPNTTGNFVITGSWAKKAYKEAKIFGEAYAAWDGKSIGYSRMPKNSEMKLQDGTAYLHITTNETIGGIRTIEWPNVNVPIIADMSSDFMSRPIPWEKFDIGKLRQEITEA